MALSGPQVEKQHRLNVRSQVDAVSSCFIQVPLIAKTLLNSKVIDIWSMACVSVEPSEKFMEYGDAGAAGPQALGAPRLNSFWDTRFSQEKAGWISWLKSSRPTRPARPRSGTTHSGASSTREAGQVLGTPTREELMAMNPNYTESLGA